VGVGVERLVFGYSVDRAMGRWTSEAEAEAFVKVASWWNGQRGVVTWRVVVIDESSRDG